MAETASSSTLRKELDEEVKEHPNWCSKDCRAFLPDAYRNARKKYSAEEVQKDYDLCHIWR